MKEQKRQAAETFILKWIEEYQVELDVNQKHALLYGVIPSIVGESIE